MISSITFSNVPDWEYDPGAWEVTSWIVGGLVQLDGENLASEGDIFAAFDTDGVVRGIAMQISGIAQYSDQTLFEMTIGSNNNLGDSIHFKYYDASENTILDI